jgi:hypothetical protein
MGVFGGVVLSAGWWMLQLWKQFGNPMFPMLNHVFKSPNFTAENFTHERFLPSSVVEWATLPFRMALPANGVYTETAAPDIRFAAIIICGFFLVCLIFWRRTRLSQRTIALLTFFTVAYIGWSVTSGNGRYLMPLLVLAGPVIVALITAITRSGKARAYLLSAVFVVQAFGVVVGADKRWGAAEWSDTWFGLELPAGFREDPGLYISIDHQPAAFLAAYAHPQSGFVNAVGQYTLTAGGESLRVLLEKVSEQRSRSWATFSVTMERSDGEPSWSEEMVSSRLKSLGMELTGEPCRYVVSNKLGADRVISKTLGEIVIESGRGRRRFAQCPVRLSPLDTAFGMEFKLRERDFRALEKNCPSLLRPQGAGIYFNGKSWEAVYVSTDTIARQVNDRFFLSSYHDYFVPIDRRVDGSYICPPMSERRSMPQTERALP